MISPDTTMVVYEPTGKPILYVWLDYETQSAESIRSGAARYAQHPSTRAYMASLHICEPGLNDTTQHRFVWTDTAWSLDMPEGWEHVSGVEWLQELFATPTHEVWVIAHNVSFERSISEYTLGLPLPARWIDTMDLANSKGLPAALGKLGELRYGTPKDEAGRNLMMKLCAPPKKGRNKGEMPDITRDDIQRLLKYSITDTVVCRRFSLDTAILMTPPEEQDIRDCHHAINHFGIGFDLDYATKLDSMEQFFVAQARANVEEVTGGVITGDDLSRVKFLLAEINANLPQHRQMDNLRARTVEDLLEDAEEDEEIPHEVVEVLKARMIVTRAALDKVRAAMASVCADGRIRDQFVYWGAHTGRWSGRGTQPQNMKKPDEDFDLQGAIDAVRLGDSAAFLKLCVDAKGRTRKPFELLGSLVRGIFIPRPGHVFVVGDYASIEARMLMWMAKQEKGLQEHRDADAGLIDDTYCSFASSIYGYEVKKKTHKKERSSGKIGQLACGFGGGANAVSRMSFGMHIDLEAAGTDAQTVVNKWRSHYNKVPPYWSEVELAFRRAADNRETSDAGRCRFWARSRRDRDRVVEIELPSGRILTYMGAAYNFSEKEGRKDRRVISYQTSNRGAVRTKEIWGGTITENCLAGETMVATLNGAKRIDTVTPEDFLWDGEAWVRSLGAISQGIQEVGVWLDTRVTGEHLILAGKTWSSVTAMDETATLAALALGRASSPWLSLSPGSATTAAPSAAATAAACAPMRLGRWLGGKLNSALRAAIGAARLCVLRLPGLRSSVGVGAFAASGTTATREWSVGATTRPTGPTATTADGGSWYAPSGSQIGRHSSATLSPCLAMTKPGWMSTARTICGGMNRATSAWWNARSTAATAATTCVSSASESASPFPRSASGSPPCGGASTPCSTISTGDSPSKMLWRATGERTEVFDIVDCGPRHRFTVLTSEGPVIVHNCVQAASRDCLARTIRAAVYEEGYDVPLHVHDEVVLEVPEAQAESAKAWLGDYMSQPPPWAPDLPLSCTPSIMTRYGKD